MSRHSETAVTLFRQGYNCAQAVFAAFCDETGMDREAALKIASSFGGGMGRLRETCGAVTGMLMAAGALYGYTDPKNAAAKAELYTLVQELAYSFKEKNGSYICRELLGLDGPDSPVPVPGAANLHHSELCGGFVACAAEIMDEYIGKKANG